MQFPVPVPSPAQAKNTKLQDLGLQPNFLSEGLIDSLLSFALEVRGMGLGTSHCWAEQSVQTRG